MCCFKMKISGTVNGRSSGLKHNMIHFAASVQRTWYTIIQILHICNDMNSYYSSQQTKFVCLLVSMLTALEDPMCKCSS